MELPFGITEIRKRKNNRNDKIYESCQYLAYGLLVGYFGLYVMDWVKSWKKDAENVPKQKNSEPKQAQTN